MRAIQGAQRAAADIGQRFVDGVDFYRSGVALLGDDVSYAVGLVLKVRVERRKRSPVSRRERSLSLTRTFPLADPRCRAL